MLAEDARAPPCLRRRACCSQWEGNKCTMQTQSTRSCSHLPRACIGERYKSVVCCHIRKWCACGTASAGASPSEGRVCWLSMV